MPEVVFQNIVNLELLEKAWKSVKSRAASGGIDNVTLQMFENELGENLQNLLLAIQNREYAPEPYKTVFIPKNENEKREIGLLSVKDKIVQQAVKLMIEPSFEARFLDVCYSYRPNKSTTQAIRRINDFIQNRKLRFFAVCDIDNFFDEIHHDILFSKIKKIIPDSYIVNLLEMWMKMGNVDSNLNWKDRTIGIPQGSIISPLLSNFYLQPFDRLMTSKKNGYIRYADDFIILTYTQKELDETLHNAKKFLNNNLKLRLNNKLATGNVNEEFSFLGINFLNGQNTISNQKFIQLTEALNNNLVIENGFFSKKFFETHNGISNYYAKLLPNEILERLDNHLLQALQQKRNTLLESLNGNLQSFENLLFKLRFYSKTFATTKAEIIKQIVDNKYIENKIQEKIPIAENNTDKKDFKKKKNILLKKKNKTTQQQEKKTHEER